MAVLLSWCVLAVAAASVAANSVASQHGHGSSDPLAKCPGYKASHVKTSSSGLTAELTLAGPACNVYGTDLKDLRLEVVYETGKSSSCKNSSTASNKL